MTKPKLSLMMINDRLLDT